MDVSKTFGNNYGLSSSCGSYSTTSGSMVAVTNLSKTIVSSGRPVKIQLTPEVTSSSSSIKAFGTGTTAPSSTIELRRNGTTICALDISCADVWSVSAQGTGSISAQGTNVGNGAANTGITAGANSGIAIARTGTNSSITIPPGSFSQVDPVSAGSNTYTVYCSTNGTLQITRVCLFVYEI